MSESTGQIHITASDFLGGDILLKKYFTQRFISRRDLFHAEGTEEQRGGSRKERKGAKQYKGVIINIHYKIYKKII
jgi:hypothetical protein